MSCRGNAAVRARLEEREKLLSPYATTSVKFKGRQRYEPPCPLRTVFQHDRDRILHTNAFRRLKHKTQVFIAPTGDHYVTRLTHTLEVNEVARTIARALNLNEDLVEAIALGHDLGHTPFGHVGESVLNELYAEGFTHSVQSLRVVDTLENQGRGLNLTWEVRQGIVSHSKPRGDFIASTWPDDLTLEAQVVRLSDAVAYLEHDIEDAIRAGMLREKDFPALASEILGKDRRNSMTRDIVEASWAASGEAPPNAKPKITMSQEGLEAFNLMRDFMFERVYIPVSNGRESLKAQEIVKHLYQHLVKHPKEIPHDFFAREESLERVVVDYLAGMTDNFALRLAERIKPGIRGGVFTGFT